ncbi:hypothetical protein ACJZ2D_006706 [Fusarium nematophilum]
MTSTYFSSLALHLKPIIQKLPYFTLPLLILTAFSCPPFRGRGLLFATVIAANDYACTVSPWPPNIGDTRPMRYGMAGSWLFVLPALERLLLHVPERDFWLLDQAGQVNNGRPKEFTWEKLCWAASLVTTPRGVGWNFGCRRLNALRADLKIKRVGKLNFFIVKLFRAFLAYLALDVVVFAARKATMPTAWVWDFGTITQIAFLELLMGLSVYTTMTLQFELSAMVAVVSGRSRPHDWPALFGSITECYTISNVWGKFWHGYIRQPVLGISYSIISVLKLTPRSPLAYLVHLVTAFAISCFFHVLTLYVICDEYLEPSILVTNMGLFFMAQPIATIAESMVIEHWKDAELSRFDIPDIILRTIGYAWVSSWSILIIGGTSGIGFAVAEACVEYGAHIVVSSRSQSKTDNAITRLGSANPGASGRIRGHVVDLKNDTEASVAH